jgi:hypothetical protein
VTSARPAANHEFAVTVDGIEVRLSCVDPFDHLVCPRVQEPKPKLSQAQWAEVGRKAREHLEEAFFRPRSEHLFPANPRLSQVGG